MQFDHCQFTSLAKIILYEYQKCFPGQFSVLSTLEQMLLSILLFKDNQLESQLRISQSELAQFVQESYLNQDEHFRHMTQSQEEVLQAKDIKIMKRLINVKNETKLRLEHIMKKYNQLKAVVLEFNEKYESLKIEADSAKMEHKLKVQKLVLKESEIDELKQRANLMMRNQGLFKEQLSNLKQQQQQVSEWMKDYLKGFQVNIIHAFSLVSQAYELTIETLVQRQNEASLANEIKTKQQQTRIISLTSLNNELVFDLGEAINFKKTSNEQVDEWIQKYHHYKASREANEKQSALRDNVMKNFGIKDYSNFIMESRRLLNKYK